MLEKPTDQLSPKSESGRLARRYQLGLEPTPLPLSVFISSLSEYHLALASVLPTEVPELGLHRGICVEVCHLFTNELSFPSGTPMDPDFVTGNELAREAVTGKSCFQLIWTFIGLQCESPENRHRSVILFD